MPDEFQVGDEPITPAVETTGDTPAEPATEPAAEKPAKKTAAKKTAAKKTAAKKPAAKKAAAKKPAAKKTAAKATEPAPDEQLPLDEGAAAPVEDAPAAVKKTTRTRRTTTKAAQAPEATTDGATEAGEQTEPAPAKKAPAKRTSKKPAVEPAAVDGDADADGAASTKPAKKTAAKKTGSRAKKSEPAAEQAPETTEAAVEAEETEQGAPGGAPVPLFQAPDASKATRARRTTKATEVEDAAQLEGEDADEDDEVQDGPVQDGPVQDAQDTDDQDSDDQDGDTDGDQDDDDQDGDQDGEGGSSSGRRRRRRGGRRRRRGGGGGGGQGGDQQGQDQNQDQDTSSEGGAEDGSKAESKDGAKADSKDGAGSEESGQNGGQNGGQRGGQQGGHQGDRDDQGESSGSSRRRRRRRRSGEGDGDGGDDPTNTVTRVRSARSAEDQITALSGSTRLEAKKQRRREGREAGRRRAPIASEAEFLARRESVERVMVIREREDLTQIAVLEDKVLVEHYVARESQTSLIGNVYLGRVQNVLPSMEAAFIDIGKGRNAVLYAGEVNWSALGHKEGQPRKIESVLSSGQSVLVQVTKDPVGHKGARLTSQISLAGRFLVYVPDGTTSGISRKLPDTERARLKALLKEIVPDTAGVIVRTAAEGASEEELTRDVERLKARWEDVEKKAKGSAPQLLYGEPDLTLKVVRDLFTEDFAKLVIQGDDSWSTVQDYVQHVAPDLADRLERFEPAGEGRDAGKDVFATYRIDEQIAKGLDRKVWLPSGGSLVIDRTEAMTVVDVNTGKFTGSGGNLEETVTKNNLEAAEEVVRQLRLRDIGGIIVVDFIDMVLESNRDLVLRRLVECLGRDRTRHQVAEVTSLGLVQMTRKRIGTGLLEAFSENCTHCQGRGLVVHDHPVDPKRGGGDDDDRGGRGRRSRGGKGKGDQSGNQSGNQGGNQS
ncbi:MAG: Rne/Rng family ribonuclease, partial [Actinobacteria bacterium]|nr:Rne/Rng family ribonuclease [Actinomycetota bacterium]